MAGDGAACPGPIDVYLKLNTGMNRLGLHRRQAQRARERLQALPQRAVVSH